MKTNKKTGHPRAFTLVELIVIIVVIVFIAMLIMPTGQFVPESKAIRALKVQGFTDIKITHRAIWFVSWRGGDGDAVRFTATATNPIGKQVTVYVFSGWLFKGATVRSP